MLLCTGEDSLPLASVVSRLSYLFVFMFYAANGTTPKFVVAVEILFLGPCTYPDQMINSLLF